MNPKVDRYFMAGCGRCSLYDTPQCKVHNWQAELAELRSIILEFTVTEELKWGVPVYAFEGTNMLLISAFKEHCVISFFKGTLLKDTHSILVKPGDNSQSVRWVKFTDITQVIALRDTLKSYIQEAIEIEKSGLKVTLKKISEYTIPAELQNKFEEDSVFKAAFAALTPGRQRGYILHFSAPKQSQTRESRIEKCMPQIFEGKGMND